MELIRDCRNCNGLSNCMNIFGFVIDANKCSQFEMIHINNNTIVKNCANCRNNPNYNNGYAPPHTCDICTSLDQEEEYEIWEGIEL